MVTCNIRILSVTFFQVQVLCVLCLLW